MSDEMREWERKYEAAMEMISNLCRRQTDPKYREWIMSIPARPDHDPDLVIGEALRAMKKEIVAGRAAEEALAELRETYAHRDTDLIGYVNAAHRILAPEGAKKGEE
jgi:hypothetical protein